MRPTDLAAVAVTLAASLLIVQATWTPPDVALADVGLHTGERIATQGMVIDVRRYDDVTWFTLVADGVAVHARAEGLALGEDSWVEVTATVDRDGGRPLLRVETIIRADNAHADHIDILALALEPAAYADRLISVQGHLERGVLEGKGSALRTTAHGGGAVTLEGVLRYEPRCLCYMLHVDPWTP